MALPLASPHPHAHRTRSLSGRVAEPPHEDRHQLLHRQPVPGGRAGDSHLPASQPAGGHHRVLAVWPCPLQGHPLSTGELYRVPLITSMSRQVQKSWPYISLSDPRTCLSDRTRWLSQHLCGVIRWCRHGQAIQPYTGGHRHSLTYSYRAPPITHADTVMCGHTHSHLQGHGTQWREAQADTDRHKCPLGLLPDPKGGRSERPCWEVSSPARVFPAPTGSQDVQVGLGSG